MSQFTVSGRFQSREGWRSFSKEVTAPNERVAREYAFSQFGSEHGLKRPQIRIDGVDA